MRMLERNKTDYYYAKYLGEEEILDSDGYYTGDKRVVYSEPIATRDNISASKGDAVASAFGTFADYDSLITTDKSDMTENSVLWVGVPVDGPYNYTVRRISRSVNSVVIAIKRVDVSE